MLDKIDAGGAETLFMASPGDITILLRQVEVGRAAALDELMELVYRDLEGIALSHLSRRFGQRANVVTMEPAALVNETFLRLTKQRKTYDNRGQFFAVATKVMLRVLVDYQRERLAARRGGGRKRITLFLDGRSSPGCGPGKATQIEIECLVKALERLEALDPRQAEVVKPRVVWGLEIQEIGLDNPNLSSMLRSLREITITEVDRSDLVEFLKALSGDYPVIEPPQSQRRQGQGS